MKKLALLTGGLLATATAAVIGAGAAASQPDAGSLNVVGEPYMKALQILKSQGVKTRFNGAFGSALPQAQCLVDSQKISSGGVMLLSLDCSPAAKETLSRLGPSGGPTVGANGITTVTPTPVVPIQGAPGAGTPPPVG